MSAFDHVVLLLSFVFALALTHLLSRVGSLLLARRRAVFSALQASMVINAILTVYLNWLVLWDLRGIKQWDLLSITAAFVLALTNYFLCAAAAPEVAGDGPVDAEQFYWENYRLFYGFVFLELVASLFANFVFLKTSDPGLFISTNVDTLPFFLPVALALIVSRRWAQWTGAIGLLALSIWWLMTFSSALM